MEYEVPVMFSAWGKVTVEAENKEDLFKKLQDKNIIDKLPLPLDWEYIDDSYVIDYDSLEEES